MAITLNTLVAHTTATAAEVNENFTALKNAIEGINLAQTNSDLFQAGVLESTDWSFTATINSATGKLSSEAATGGAAWLPGETSGLVRTFTSSASISGLEPGALPISTKFMPMAFELHPTGSTAAVTIKVGAEYAAENEAEEHYPGTTSGRMQIRTLIVKNNAGTYEIKKQTDARPWAPIGSGKVANEKRPENLWPESAYSALIERTSGTEYEPSATRPTFVSLVLESTGELTIISMEVLVGGVLIAKPRIATITEHLEHDSLAYGFICPPAVKWKATAGHTGSGSTTLKSSYLTL